jgi:DNA-binding NarL/FixJ family response regulator
LRALRAVIVDEHPSSRFRLREFLARTRNIRVVADASTYASAIEVVLQEQPDIVIVDIALPDYGAMRTVERIRRELRRTRSIVLGMHEDIGSARAAFAAGADAYILKRAVSDELFAAIRQVGQGGHYVDSSIAGQLTAFERPVATSLSQREHQVLRGVALGYTSADIADELGLSPKSIESYRARLRNKLGLESRRDIVRYALEFGIIRPSTAEEIPAVDDDNAQGE